MCFSVCFWFGSFFNPDLIHLLEVCMIPAGLATYSIVFVGLQTSILCFPCVIFISRFDSKQDISNNFLKGKSLKFNDKCLFKLT